MDGSKIAISTRDGERRVSKVLDAFSAASVADIYPEADWGMRVYSRYDKWGDGFKLTSDHVRMLGEELIELSKGNKETQRVE